MITIAIGSGTPVSFMHLLGALKDFADVLVWPATANPPRIKAPQIIEPELVRRISRHTTRIHSGLCVCQLVELNEGEGQYCSKGGSFPPNRLYCLDGISQGRL